MLFALHLTSRQRAPPMTSASYCLRRHHIRLRSNSASECARQHILHFASTETSEAGTSSDVFCYR